MQTPGFMLALQAETKTFLLWMSDFNSLCIYVAPCALFCKYTVLYAQKALEREDVAQQLCVW